MEKFRANLLQKGFDYVVVMGDLFDHPYVSFSVVLDAYRALVNAAATNRKTQYIVLAGNHDMPRNIEAVGAFTMLEAMCHLRADNLQIVSTSAQIGKVACFPWKWHMAARDQKILAPVAENAVELVVGHWDLIQYGEHDDHMAPAKSLRERYGDVPLWTGHYHIAGDYAVDGVTVHCTGSMEPYSHGEDPKGEIYVTMTPEQIEKADAADLRDKCIRVLLSEGQEMPTGIDCLAMTPKRLTFDKDDLVLVTGGEFNWTDILDKKLSDLPEHVQIFIKERLHSE